jgi:hypothetical protein
MKKIPSFLLLFFGFLFFLYVFYKSEIFWEGERRGNFLVFYFLSISILLISIFNFFCNQKTKIYMYITFLSIVFSLYCLETYLFFELDKQSEKTTIYKNQTGKSYDLRNGYEIYKDYKDNKEDIAMNVPPLFYLNDNKNNSEETIIPSAGISNKKTIYCNENGYYSIYDSDRYGFNNPDTEWDKKEIEYLLVGDSFTHGACVNRPNDIASVLRTLSNKSVLNLGMGSNGPLTEYSTLREYLNPNVKKVLWIYYESNDLSDLNTELKNEILKNYYTKLTFTQNLKTKQKEIDILAKQMIKNRFSDKKIKRKDTLNFFKLTNVRMSLVNYLPNKYYPHPQNKPQAEFIKIIKLAKDLTSKNNSKLYFIYLPEYSRYTKSYDEKSYFSVKKIVEELNIEFIDIHAEVFIKTQNPLELFPFGMLNHYTVEGYRTVAEKIYEFTKD